MAGCSQNGKDLGLVPYSGYTENVSHLSTVRTHSQADAFQFRLS